MHGALGALFEQPLRRHALAERLFLFALEFINGGRGVLPRLQHLLPVQHSGKMRNRWLHRGSRGVALRRHYPKNL